MSTRLRHHITGRFASPGARPSRTEIPRGSKPAKPSGANAQFNKQALRQGGPARGATPGQLVGAGVIKGN